jgi:hypothetical protein
VSLQVSPLDTVQDVRQYLFETPEASDLTSYTLLLEGKPINDYAELSELPHLRPDSSLVMAPGTLPPPPPDVAPVVSCLDALSPEGRPF